MHELGTVFYVIQEVEKVVEENHLTQVASVTLEVGEVSGIIPYYLTDCWKWAVEKSQYLQGRGAEDRDAPRRDLLRGLQTDISNGQIRQDMPALQERAYLSAQRQRVHHQGDRSLLAAAKRANGERHFRRSPCSTCRKTPMVFRRKARSLLRAEFVRRWRTNSTLAA